MATAQGYTDGSFDYKHMYNMIDLKGPLPRPVIHQYSILGVLYREEHMKIFFNMMVQTPLLAALYNDPNSSMTIFVPSDECNYGVTKDKYRDFILSHTINYKLEPCTLFGSKMQYLNTKLNGYRLLIENINEPLLNGVGVIKSAIKVGKSIVYQVSCPLFPL